MLSNVCSVSGLLQILFYYAWFENGFCGQTVKSSILYYLMTICFSKCVTAVVEAPAQTS